MAHKTCEDCGERIYNLGCVNCNEAAYIAEQLQFDRHYGEHATWGDEPDREQQKSSVR